MTALATALNEAVDPLSRKSARQAVAGNFDIGRVSGLSAGDGFSNWSAWVGYSNTFSEDDLISTAFDARLHSVLAGVDTSPLENLVLGIAIGYENNDVDTHFSNGEQDIDGFTVAPYLGYLLTPNISADLSFGYTDFEIDQIRTGKATLTPVTGDTDSTRWFVSGNLNGQTTYGNFIFAGRAGVIWSEEDQDGVIEVGNLLDDPVAQPSQTIQFGQVQVGGEIAYSGGVLEPYASVFYEYDFEREEIRLNLAQTQPENDRDGVRVGFGGRYFGSNGLSGSLEWSFVADREDFDSHAVRVNARLEF